MALANFVGVEVEVAVRGELLLEALQHLCKNRIGQTIDGVVGFDVADAGYLQRDGRLHQSVQKAGFVLPCVFVVCNIISNDLCNCQ